MIVGENYHKTKKKCEILQYIVTIYSFTFHYFSIKLLSMHTERKTFVRPSNFIIIHSISIHPLSHKTKIITSQHISIILNSSHKQNINKIIRHRRLIS